MRPLPHTGAITPTLLLLGEQNHRCHTVQIVSEAPTSQQLLQPK